MIDEALALCKKTEATPELVKTLSQDLCKLGFQHTWSFPDLADTVWTHPMVKEHNSQCNGAAILNSYACDLRNDGKRLWYCVGRLGNQSNFVVDLPEEEYKKCPKCNGRMFYGFLKYDSKLVLKPGNKRRTRVQVEVRGWRCLYDGRYECNGYTGTDYT